MTWSMAATKSALRDALRPRLDPRGPAPKLTRNRYLLVAVAGAIAYGLASRLGFALAYPYSGTTHLRGGDCALAARRRRHRSARPLRPEAVAGSRGRRPPRRRLLDGVRPGGRPDRRHGARHRHRLRAARAPRRAHAGPARPGRAHPDRLLRRGHGPGRSVRAALHLARRRSARGRQRAGLAHLVAVRPDRGPDRGARPADLGNDAGAAEEQRGAGGGCPARRAGRPDVCLLAARRAVRALPRPDLGLAAPAAARCGDRAARRLGADGVGHRERLRAVRARLAAGQPARNPALPRGRRADLDGARRRDRRASLERACCTGARPRAGGAAAHRDARRDGGRARARVRADHGGDRPDAGRVNRDDRALRLAQPGVGARRLERDGDAAVPGRIVDRAERRELGARRGLPHRAGGHG